MASSRYSQSVDLDNWNSSHSLAVLSVPPGSRVLDLGAADGSVARALKKRGCTVWGIEQDERAAEAALQVCDRLIVADLETKEAFEPLGSETFDVVLALDVLEHLRDPAPVLKRAASHLTPKGVVVVSIPNVTHGALRLSLLEGRFTYTEQGLLDRTHLRFFDRQAAERLISDAGLTISQNLRVRRELDETEIAVDKNGLSAELLQSLASDPDTTTYQFVFVAERVNGLHASLPSAMLSERLLAQNEALLKQSRELETYTKSLEADRAARLDSSESCSPKTRRCLSNLGNSKRTQRIWKRIGRRKWTVPYEKSKSVRMSSSRPDLYKLGPPLSLSKFNESATNFARNSFGALQRPIKCTGTSNTLKPMWLSRMPSFLSCANSYER